MPTRGLQRAGPIALLAALLRDMGMDPLDISRSAGSTISLDTLKPEDMLPFFELLALLDCAIARTGDELLSVKLGLRYRWHNHGILHRLSLVAPTLRQALLDVAEWQRLFSQSAVVYLQRIGDDFGLGYGTYVPARGAVRHLYIMSARVALNYLEDLTGGAVRPLEIHLCVSPPQDIVAFRRMFNCPVLFNQSQSCVIIQARDIDWPMPRFNPSTRAAMLRELRSLSQPKQEMAWRVQRIIRPQLLREDPTMAGAAEQLGFHPRTLRRALAAEGTTFEEIRDDVRNTIAHELLVITQLDIGEISGVLAFSSHAAFVRAFHRWNGMTPSAWRAKHSAH